MAFSLEILSEKVSSTSTWMTTRKEVSWPNWRNRSKLLVTGWLYVMLAPLQSVVALTLASGIQREMENESGLETLENFESK